LLGSAPIWFFLIDKLIEKRKNKETEEQK
jgi:hypothetical protein